LIAFTGAPLIKSPRSHPCGGNYWVANNRAWGRPVDVQVMPDGALLFSDDTANAIYRIAY
jgi:hypothetical protein